MRLCTVIAQAISAICCLIYIVKKYPILHLEKKNFELRKGSFGKLMALGIPMALQFSITAIGTIIVQGAVNVYGAVYMAGFSAAGKIQNIITMVAVSMGATIATYVGQNRGAGRMDRVREGVRYSWIMLLAWSAIEMALMYFSENILLTFLSVLRKRKWLRYLLPTSRQCSGHIRFCVLFFFFEMRFREWDMDWFLCWAVCLNWWQERLLCSLWQEKQLCRGLSGRPYGVDRSLDSSHPILLLRDEKI